MPANHAVEACLSALQTYLTNAIAGLTVLDEWPDANQQLTYPSVTLFSGKVATMNRQPEQIAITTPDINNQVVATEVIGEHDFKIQMDLWCSNKVQRDVQLGLLLNAINAQADDASGKANAAGLSLQLTDYFNDWVRFDIDGTQYMDNERAAETLERRVKIDLLVNCRAIQNRTYYAMVKIQSNVGATTSNNQMAPNTSNTDQSQLPSSLPSS